MTNDPFDAFAVANLQAKGVNPTTARQVVAVTYGCYMNGCDRPLAHPTVDYCDYHAPHPHDEQL